MSNGLNLGNSLRNYNSETEYYFDRYSLKSLSSDMLLGILLVSCGILGSIMSTMRDGKGNASKAIVLGASVGFVVLLGVKGGTTVFILSTTGTSVPFNPYSTAFAGVVAGMFSEKLYLALSKLTDKAFGNADDATIRSTRTLRASALTPVRHRLICVSSRSQRRLSILTNS